MNERIEIPYIDQLILKYRDFIRVLNRKRLENQISNRSGPTRAVVEEMLIFSEQLVNSIIIDLKKLKDEHER